MRGTSMAIGFVPEGQHDSSQARSAWNHEENGPVPGPVPLWCLSSYREAC